MHISVHSLDDFVSSRQGVASDGIADERDRDEDDPMSTKAQRIAAHRERQKAAANGGGNFGRVKGTNKNNMKAVHLLSMEEIASLFGDVTAGLSFLVCARSCYQWNCGLIGVLTFHVYR
jgi:hypothetical protein